MTLTATEFRSAIRRQTAKVVVNGVSKRFGNGRDAVVALDHVDLAIGPSEFFCLVGPSGCGKTTVLKILAGLHTADGGTVQIGNARTPFDQRLDARFEHLP